MAIFAVGASLACVALVTFSLTSVLFGWFGFLLMNFAGHAAIHREYFERSKAGDVLNELLLLVAYGLHFSNYHHIVIAHLGHHIDGRLQEYGEADVVEQTPSTFDFVKYYFFLLIVPFNYWIIKGWLDFLRAPFKRSYEVTRVGSLEFYFPYFIPQCFSLVLLLFAATANTWGFVLYWSAATLTWNILQNVAHYGLTGNNDYERRLASRTYLVGPALRLITFGSLAHLPHHFDMKVPGKNLHDLDNIAKIEASIGSKVRISVGLKHYLQDVFRQFRGPIKRSELSRDWLYD